MIGHPGQQEVEGPFHGAGHWYDSGARSLAVGEAGRGVSDGHGQDNRRRPPKNGVVVAQTGGDPGDDGTGGYHHHGGRWRQAAER